MAKPDDLFFAPGASDLQGKLVFLPTSPEKVVAFPIEADQFTGLNLHWNGSESVVCLDPEDCAMHKRGVPVRPYFYSPAYAYCFETKTWRRCIFPIGGEVAKFAALNLRGSAWKIKSRIDKWNKKKGLSVTPFTVSADVKAELQSLESFDIRHRILSRYQLA